MKAGVLSVITIFDLGASDFEQVKNAVEEQRKITQLRFTRLLANTATAAESDAARQTHRRSRL